MRAKKDHEYMEGVKRKGGESEEDEYDEDE